MDFIVNSAVEEICSHGSDGLTLPNLWPKLSRPLTEHGLDLCPYVKAALWSSLLKIHGLQFEAQGVPYDAKDDSGVIKSVEKCEMMNLKIVASDQLRRNFLGIYDFPFTQPQRRTLERLAVARTDGITQSELAKEFHMKANNIFHILRNLEANGLIVRQPTVMRTKKACGEGGSGNSAVSTTNMLHLRRYARHLGCQQRLEVIKEANPIADGDSGNSIGFAEESKKKDVHVKDYLPALKAICDKLEQAQNNVLVVSDIKQDLGFQGVLGHRNWRNISRRLKEAQIVEEFHAEVNKKEVTCMRLLKKFSRNHFERKPSGLRDDMDAEESIQLGKRGQITDQVVELPIMHQAYDMIHGEERLASHEVCKRLGMQNKWYKERIQNMHKIHLLAACSDDRDSFPAWTSGNSNTGAPNIVTSKLGSASDGSNRCDQPTMDLEVNRNLIPTIEGVNIAPFKHDRRSSNDTAGEPEVSESSRADEEGNAVLPSLKTSDAYDLDPIGRVPDIEMKPASIMVPDDSSLELSTPAISTLSRCQSHQNYRCLTLGAVSARREQNILQMLEGEKFLLRPELHRRLENLEKVNNKIICRKTIDRILNKLQLEGQCKCISISIPATTHLGHRRTTQVVLHPSIHNVDPETLGGHIYERLRSFEIKVRSQSYSRLQGKSLKVMNGVQRISNNVKMDNQLEQAEAKPANGHVLGKMVRAKLLHIFIWRHLSSSPGWDNDDKRNSHSNCRSFEAYAVIKAMPLELFLQVIGASQKFENLTDKHSSGLQISDLPSKEYKCLMDARSIRNLSWLIDILRRLKLLRFVSAKNTAEVENDQNTHLAYALELKPYIEEPVSIVSSPSGFFFPDQRPRVRHDFVLLTRKAVDEYWSTLEYLYAVANPKAALHAFPGSVVREVFFSRSWASDQVTLADKCVEHIKCFQSGDPHKKLSTKECEKIAKDLKMSVSQMLHFLNKKQQTHQGRLPGDSYTEGKQTPKLGSRHTRASRKRKRTSKGMPPNHLKANTEDRQSKKDRLTQISVSVDQFTEKGDSLVTSSEAYEYDLHQDHIDDQLDPVDEQESDEEDTDSFIHNCTLSRLRPGRQKRFSWTEAADRKLVIEYARHRAALGAKYHRTNWGSLSNLPAPPNTCRRRMALLKGSKQFRNAVMKLCNMLAKRYAKYLEKFQNLSNQADGEVMVRKCMTEGDCYLKFPTSFDHNAGFLSGERWDNFDDINIKIALDDVLRYKTTAKLDSSQRVYSDIQTDGCDPCYLKMDSSTPLSKRGEIRRGRSKFAVRKSISRRFPKKYSKLLNKENSVGQRVYDSVAVSNAVELFKLIFLSTSTTPPAAETLRRYSKGDLFAAFSYLREKKAIIGGTDTSPFGLSLLFLRSMSTSPFPINTGKTATRFAKWLDEREKELMEEEVDLPADLQCGDILHLCSLVSKGELSVIPYLPEEGVGEPEELITKQKRSITEFSGIDKSKRMRTSMSGKTEVICRREKGFPGIRLSLNRATIPRIKALELSKDENFVQKIFQETTDHDKTVDLQLERTPCHFDGCDTAKEILDSWGIVQTAETLDESLWEAMASYAARLFLISDERRNSPFHPDLFKIICSAIQNSGDEGLSMNEISRVLNMPGDIVSEIVVDVLEKFGRALKVLAFDSIHVVDSLYRTKYLLTSAAGAGQHPKITQSIYSQGENGDKNMQICEIGSSSISNMRSIDTHEVHRVTILDHPAELCGPSNEIQSTHQVEDQAHPEFIPEKSSTTGNMFELHSGDSPISRHILPWINGDGTTNKIVYKGLTRRLLGIVMQHPGITEGDVIQQMDTLNPQSCRMLMETMILDKHIIVRKMHEIISTEPPGILGSLFKKSIKKSTIIYRDHYFANPMSSNLL